MRIVLVADTHGYLDPRIAEIARTAERVVHAGDVGGDTILAALHPDTRRVIAVAGNNDTERHWPPDDRLRLYGLPTTHTLDLPGGQLVAVHGHRLRARDRHARLRARYPEARAVVYGHSHRLAVDTDAEPWVLNPGAAGRTRTYGGPACIVLTATAGAWEIEAVRFAPVRRPRG